jgi:hypothetical protein
VKLPNSERAIISAEKLRDYLLSPSHPIGRSKALFFERLGYTRSNWFRLEADLRAQHLSHDAEEVESTTFGRIFVILAQLAGPSSSQSVQSVWMIRSGEQDPRFVTAYPGGS